MAPKVAVPIPHAGGSGYCLTDADLRATISFGSTVIDQAAFSRDSTACYIWREASKSWSEQSSSPTLANGLLFVQLNIGKAKVHTQLKGGLFSNTLLITFSFVYFSLPAFHSFLCFISLFLRQYFLCYHQEIYIHLHLCFNATFFSVSFVIAILFFPLQFILSFIYAYFTSTFSSFMFSFILSC
ncbi:unnamed protein product [Acanthosepion pharaonis]|uniref:Uncharacterized protein n=1 Tax=Acanthosepion pharaonis TaxID=158019 RepID=A0A812DGW7_ACAPH|nr:unnamed protein product [Sepia pharaonis]